MIPFPLVEDGKKLFDHICNLADFWKSINTDSITLKSPMEN